MAPRKGKSAARRCRTDGFIRTFAQMVEASGFDNVPTLGQLLAKELSAPEVQAELQALQQAHNEEWLRLTGFDYPQSTDDFVTVGIRLGLMIDRVERDPHLLDTLLDVARGNYYRREDEARARVAAELAAFEARRAAEAAPPVIVDDEWTVIANRLSGNQPDVLVLLNADGAFAGGDLLTTEYVAEALVLSKPAVKKAVGKLKKLGLVNTAQGHGGGLQITDKGRNVAARIPRSRCRRASLAMGDGVKGAQTYPSGVVPVRRA